MDKELEQVYDVFTSILIRVISEQAYQKTTEGEDK